MRFSLRNMFVSATYAALLVCIFALAFNDGRSHETLYMERDALAINNSQMRKVCVDMLAEWFTTDNGWDEIDTMCFQFYDCTVKKEFGLYKVGDVIPTLFVDFGAGKLVIYDGNGDATDSFAISILIWVD